MEAVPALRGSGSDNGLQPALRVPLRKRLLTQRSHVPFDNRLGKLGVRVTDQLGKRTDPGVENLRIDCIKQGGGNVSGRRRDFIEAGS